LRNRFLSELRREMAMDDHGLPCGRRNIRTPDVSRLLFLNLDSRLFHLSLLCFFTRGTRNA
jgi:hypothetical protein